MNCLLCYKLLNKNEIDYHQKCVLKIFAHKQMPSIDIDEMKLINYAKELIASNTAITGVQPKLSLWLEERKTNIRFTIIESKSNYIIKPQSEVYESLPENEDLCMHLAKIFGIVTATHCLIRLPSRKLAYITKRFDRNGDRKLACEDLCQLSESLTEHKYRGSYEKTGKIISHYSTQAGLDVLNYFKLVLFSFVTGNADMHLKNFSMFEKEEGQFILCPAYDLVSTMLVIENESEQMSLTINGKKNKITKKDFDVLGFNLLLNEKQIENCYKQFLKKLDNALWWIANSFIPADQKLILERIISNRIQQLNPK
jgi:serine/threonine-protein kinase HipA